MRLVRPGLIALTIGLAAVLVLPDPALAAGDPPPSSMASLGDSISRGFNACGWFIDCTAHSFSTGTDGATDSQYLRITAVNPAMRGHAYNDAKTGARIADLPGQAAAAVSQHVGYVTMLIGANDACAGSEASMTPVATFRSSLDTALNTLKSGLPTAKVQVISIPDVKRLWQVGMVNANARNTWSMFHICQSLLANPSSTADADTARRDRVRQRVIDFNTQLAQACAAYGPDCKFDGNAAFNYPFALSRCRPGLTSTGTRPGRRSWPRCRTRRVSTGDLDGRRGDTPGWYEETMSPDARRRGGRDGGPNAVRPPSTRSWTSAATCCASTPRTPATPAPAPASGRPPSTWRRSSPRSGSSREIRRVRARAGQRGRPLRGRRPEPRRAAGARPPRRGAGRRERVVGPTRSAARSRTATCGAAARST